MRSVDHSIRILLAILLVLPSAALAIPPDKVIRMASGDAKYEQGPLGTWTITHTDAQVVKATYHDTGEVFLEAGQPGEALLLLSNIKIGRIEVWKVRVGESLPATRRPGPSGLAGTCGCGAGGEYPVECTVKNLACLAAIRAHLKGTDLSSRDVWVTYNTKIMQALLAQIQAEVDRAGFAGTELAFAGANLRVKATVKSEERRIELLLTIYRIMAGKIVLDDRIEVESRSAK